MPAVLSWTEWHLPKISAPQAWALTTGSLAQAIAVSDSGVDPNHPDLKPRLAPGWNFIQTNSNTADTAGSGRRRGGRQLTISELPATTTPLDMAA